MGYPCMNRSIGCSSSRSFRLKSYTLDRFIDTVHMNLNCLKKILEFNIDNNLLFFRITSDLIPFASHFICTCEWQTMFGDTFDHIGRFIRKYDMRISMHPDQFIVLNSSKDDVVKRSIKELEYHADVLDLLGLDVSHKIQLHVGGVYNDKEAGIHRFIKTYDRLPDKVRRRLVIENDEKSYSVMDCLLIYDVIDIPVLFDVFHHSLNPSTIKLKDALQSCFETWKDTDGLPMVDYSTQHQNKRFGSHTESIDKDDFLRFIKASSPHDFDIMLEIKDKEKSALLARDLLQNDPRFVR